MAHGWAGLRDRILDLLYPPHCLGCGGQGAWLCKACLSTVVPAGEPRTLLVEVEGGTWPLPIYSVGVHTGLPRRAVHALKYEGKRVLAEPMAAEMAALLGAWARLADWVVPVPLHRSRRRERGYNQAELLAGALATHLGLPMPKGCLARVRQTPPQVGLSVAERKENVAGAFSAHARVRERRLLLVDDVYTTGATIGACAAALAAAGGVPVGAVTFTRAGSAMDDL